ncbi:hypothetical protein TB2_042109 [Malus domestica]
MCHPPRWLYGRVASRCCLLGYGLQILTAVFLPFEDFYIISGHFQTVSSKENMQYHFKASCTVDFVLMPLMTHTNILSYEDIILALTSAYWSSEAMHLYRVIATFFHKSGLKESDSALIALYLHLKPVEKFMEIFENMWISWITQLIGMHHKEALNMQLIGIDSIVLRSAFGKHGDSEECLTWCHFNVTCNVDLMAALFVTHTTHLFNEGVFFWSYYFNVSCSCSASGGHFYSWFAFSPS